MIIDRNASMTIAFAFPKVTPNAVILDSSYMQFSGEHPSLLIGLHGEQKGYPISEMIKKERNQFRTIKLSFRIKHDPDLKASTTHNLDGVTFITKNTRVDLLRRFNESWIEEALQCYGGAKVTSALKRHEKSEMEVQNRSGMYAFPELLARLLDKHQAINAVVMPMRTEHINGETYVLAIPMRKVRQMLIGVDAPLAMEGTQFYAEGENGALLHLTQNETAIDSESCA